MDIFIWVRFLFCVSLCVCVGVRVFSRHAIPQKWIKQQQKMSDNKMGTPFTPHHERMCPLNKDRERGCEEFNIGKCHKQQFSLSWNLKPHLFIMQLLKSNEKTYKIASFFLLGKKIFYLAFKIKSFFLNGLNWELLFHYSEKNWIFYIEKLIVSISSVFFGSNVQFFSDLLGLLLCVWAIKT